MVPLLTAMGFIVSGIWSLVLAKKMFGVKFIWQSLADIKVHLEDGWHVFLSRLYVNLYSSTNILILGFMTNNTIVGYYAISEKIIQAISGLFSPVLQAFYPYFSRLYVKSNFAFFTLFKQLNLFFLLFSVLFFTVTALFSKDIVFLVSGNENPEVVFILIILSLSIITSPFGPAFTEGLLVCGKKEIVTKVVRDTFILNMIIVSPLIYLFGAVGLAVTWVVGQVFHVSLYIYQYRKVKRKILCAA